MPGELTQRNLVIDDESGEFIGFYPRPVQHSGAGEEISKVSSQTEISGSTLLNTSQNTSTGDRTSVSLALQVFNRTRYSSDKKFASLRIVLEEGASKETGQHFVKSIDRFEVRSTFIYRLSPKFGPYLRGVLSTKLFEKDRNFDAALEGNFYKLNAQGDTLTIPNPSRVTIEPSFFPLELRQGVGINSQLVRSFPLNVDVRLGLGARQILVSDAFTLSSDSTAVERKTSTSTGIEALLILDSRLAKSINFDSEFDILINQTDPGKWVFSLENRLRIFLTSFINLDLVADLQRQEGLRRITGREQILLRFSRFF